MLQILATKAAALAIAGWIAVSGAQVATHQAKSSISKQIINGGITRIVRKEEVAKHRIKPPAGYTTHGEGIAVAWSPKKAQEIAKKLSRQGYMTQTGTDPTNAKLRNVFKKKAPQPPKTTRDRLAWWFGSWVYHLDGYAYDYDRQQWVPANDPAIKQQESEDRAWWHNISDSEKMRYAELITHKGDSVEKTLQDLEQEYR